MCYHVSTPRPRALKELIDDDRVIIEAYDTHYHTAGFAHEALPAMLSGEEHRVQPVTWGFLPFWAKEADAAALMNKTLNARAETLFTTPMFRAAAPTHRCLIFVDGFFEWKHERKAGKTDKVPHFIYMPDHRPFALGGLWSDYKGTRTCNVITTSANELMTTIHNSKKRMPFIVPRAHWGTWLNTDASREEVQEVMQPYPEGALQAHEIGRLITKRGVDTDVREVQEAA